MAKHNIKANKIQLDELNGNLPVIGSDKPIRQNGVYSYDDFDLVPKWLVNQLLSELDFPDGVIENGGINVSDIDDGNISLGLFQWRLTVDGVQSIYSNSSGVTFNDIELSAPGLVRYNAFFGDDEGVISMITGDEGEVAVLPDTPENTVILGWVIITDAGADVPVIPSPGYATLGSNNFAGNQNVQGFVRANYFDANKGIYLISGRGSDPSTDTFLISGYKNVDENSFIGIQRAFGDYGFLFRIDSVTGVLDLIANPTVNGVPIGGGGIPEAPVDGKTYGRKDASWSEVVADVPTLQQVTDEGATTTVNVGFGGAASNARASFEANTATTASLRLKPSTTDYTGSELGAVTNVNGDIKVITSDGNVSLIKSLGNEILEGAYARMVEVNASGDISAVSEIIIAEITDVDLIDDIETASYTNNRATVVGVKAGQYYDDGDTYTYTAIEDDKVRRF